MAESRVWSARNTILLLFLLCLTASFAFADGAAFDLSGPPVNVRVRVKAPPGTGAVQTLSGRHINVGLDGIVEMSEGDAFCLIPVGWTILGDA